jgi:hypothetical protein
MSKLKGKIALITRGRSGIGLESKSGHVAISSQVFLAQWVRYQAGTAGMILAPYIRATTRVG